MVVVTGGIHLMELITRSRTHLSLILVYMGDEHDYAKTKEFFQKAANLGLVEIYS